MRTVKTNQSGNVRNRPVKTKRRSTAGPQPTIRLTLVGYVVAWLAPTLAMSAIIFILSAVDNLAIAPIILSILPTVAIASVAIGLPGTLLVNWVFRHQLKQSVHVLGYAIVGMLYGLTVLFNEIGGAVPLLIPYIGVPAAILLALGRLAARPLVTITYPEKSETPSTELEPEDSPQS